MNSLHPKVAAGTVAGAATILLLGLLARFHVEVSPLEASAVAVVIQSLAGYLKRA